MQNLTSINRAAYRGNIDELSKFSEEAVNDLDANGLAPIDYAILGHQNAAVQKLIEV